MKPKTIVFSSLKILDEHIVDCRLCPRLVRHRENVPPNKLYEKESYWRRPLPGFGDPKAWLLITGLAPSANGGNRTGRIFTGDLTSKFLMKALHKTGFANMPSSLSKSDGLKLTGCYLTAVVKCVPPGNKPTTRECINCLPYYQNELRLLKNITHVLLLGKLAFDAFKLTMKLQGNNMRGLKFEHGKRYELDEPKIIAYACYHPSPQNTNTGVLTEKSFVGLLQKLRNEHK